MIVIWSLQNKLRFLSAGNKSSINHFEWIFKSFWLKRVTGVIIPILHGMNSSIELKQPKCCGLLTNLVGDQVGLGKKKISKDIKTQQMACYMHLHQLPCIWPNQHAFRECLMQFINNSLQLYSCHQYK